MYIITIINPSMNALNVCRDSLKALEILAAKVVFTVMSFLSFLPLKYSYLLYYRILYRPYPICFGQIFFGG